MMRDFKDDHKSSNNKIKHVDDSPQEYSTHREGQIEARELPRNPHDPKRTGANTSSHHVADFSKHQRKTETHPSLVISPNHQHTLSGITKIYDNHSNKGNGSVVSDRDTTTGSDTETSQLGFRVQEGESSITDKVWTNKVGGKRNENSIGIGEWHTTTNGSHNGDEKVLSLTQRLSNAPVDTQAGASIVRFNPLEGRGVAEEQSRRVEESESQSGGGTLHGMSDIEPGSTRKSPERPTTSGSVPSPKRRGSGLYPPVAIPRQIQVFGETNMQPAEGSSTHPGFSPGTGLSIGTQLEREISNASSYQSEVSNPAVRSRGESPGSQESTESGARVRSSEEHEEREEPKRKKRSRVLMTTEQQTYLYQVWNTIKFPLGDQREAIANRIGLTPRQVQVWFQNQRQKFRRQLNEAGGVPPGEDPRNYADLGSPVQDRPIPQDRYDRTSQWAASHSGSSQSNVTQSQPPTPTQSHPHPQRDIQSASSAGLSPGWDQSRHGVFPPRDERELHQDPRYSRFPQQQQRQVGRYPSYSPEQPFRHILPGSTWDNPPPTGDDPTGVGWAERPSTNESSNTYWHRPLTSQSVPTYPTRSPTTQGGQSLPSIRDAVEFDRLHPQFRPSLHRQPSQPQPHPHPYSTTFSHPPLPDTYKPRRSNSYGSGATAESRTRTPPPGESAPRTSHLPPELARLAIAHPVGYNLTPGSQSIPGGERQYPSGTTNEETPRATSAVPQRRRSRSQEDDRAEKRASGSLPGLRSIFGYRSPPS